MKTEKAFYNRHWFASVLETLRSSAVIFLFFVSFTVKGEDKAEIDANDTDLENSLDLIVVTANRYTQNLQDVSSFLTVISDDTIARLDLSDITGIEAITAGLRLGRSGDELRPAMRGARTNEVGVAGTGIAEQIVGIFVDDVYVPTTTSALETSIDLERIEVLRGPQGTLYGRNTFAGSINVISKQPEFGDFFGEVGLSLGNYQQRKLHGIVNTPWSDTLTSRLVFATDQQNGVISNLFSPGSEDDLREKNNRILRGITLWQPKDNFEVRLRLDYSSKAANSDAIWGYQQIAGYQLVPSATRHGEFEPDALIRPGHIYQPENAVNNDISPYQVYRNALSFSRNDKFTATLKASWIMDFANLDWISSFNRFSAQQFYDNDYSDGGFDVYGGFGRQDDQETLSTELRLVSEPDGNLGWLAGLYFFEQEADWEWLWREDINEDGIPDQIVVPAWGNPEHDPHTASSLAVYGQFNIDLTQSSRLSLGARFQRDKKSFTGMSSANWRDNALLYKVALEYDLNKQQMFYTSISTGYRSGGVNELRVVNRGAPAQYGNERVTSYEIGMNNQFDDGKGRLNLALFANHYHDVKAQLFAVACNDSADLRTVIDCVHASAATTFEYYENGGDIESVGLELDASWQFDHNWELFLNLALLDAEFQDGFQLGNSVLRPYLGLGNIQNRQNINDPNSRFDYSGWRPGLSPEFDLSISILKRIESSRYGSFTPFILFNYVAEHYAFDTNLPEALVGEHLIINANLTWEINQRWHLSFSAKNITNQQVITRAVVHSQLVQGLPANSVQANWNDPPTYSIAINYQF